MKHSKSHRLTALLVLALPGLLLAIEPPAPVAPPNGSKASIVRPELTVSCPGADLYHFTLYAQYDDRSVPIAERQTTNATWIAPDEEIGGTIPAELKTGIYYWTCRARSDGVWSDFFMPAWYFEVEDQGSGTLSGFPFAPPPPVPVSPASGSKTTITDPELVVQADASLFHFRVYGSEGLIGEAYVPKRRWRAGGNILVNGVQVEKLRPGIYHWTCRAQYTDGNGWSEFFTPPWSFEVERPGHKGSTDGTAGGQHASVLPGVASVEPNPCGANGTSINFNVGDDTRVSAVVYTVTGKLVKRLAGSHIQRAGVHRFVWDGTDETGSSVGTGTYLCRVAVGDGRDVVKIVKSR